MSNIVFSVITERLDHPESFGARDVGFVDYLDKAYWKKPDYGTLACSQDTSVISSKSGPWKKPAKVKMIRGEDISIIIPKIDHSKTTLLY